MTRTKRMFTGIIAIMMVAITLFVTTVPAFAATSSSGKSTRTIIVQTKANWWIPGGESITLSQTKGVCTERNFSLSKRQYVTKTSKQYGEWDIVARATDGSHTTTATLKGGSVKVKLKPNKTYKITVTWDSTGNMFTELDHGTFTTLPTWRVKSTYKVSNYY